MTDAITLTEDSPVHAALRMAVCVPTKRYLWTPSDAIEFVPALCSTVFGDGRALLSFTTVNNRPAFYVVRIDSRWTIDDDRDPPEDAADVREFVDDICEALEDEFGRRDPDSEETDPEILEYGNPWPAISDRDGCMWGRMDWPNLPGFTIVKHPYSRTEQILSPQYVPFESDGFNGPGKAWGVREPSGAILYEAMFTEAAAKRLSELSELMPDADFEKHRDVLEAEGIDVSDPGVKRACVP